LEANKNAIKGAHRYRYCGNVIRCNGDVAQVFVGWLSGLQLTSPAFILSEVPPETKRLAFKMIDRDVPTYPHGGGTVIYSGKDQIPAGAFSYRGPCPPSGQQHTYEWSVQALDQGGKTIRSANAAETFPSR